MWRKGIGGHVDWIIGIGLFLIYIAMLFTFFKPGISDVFEPETLLDIVEEGFRQNATWELSKTPLFLEALEDYQCLYGAPPEPTTPAYDYRIGYFHLDGELDQSAVTPTFLDFVLDLPPANHFEIFYVPTETDEEVCNIFYDEETEFNALNYCIEPSEDRDYSVKFSEDDDLTVPTPLGFDAGDILKYVIISSEEESISSGAASLPLSDTCDGLDMNHYPACNILNYDEGTYADMYDQSEDSCFAKYSIGVTEQLVGINIEAFTDGDFVAGCSSSPDPYTCAKTAWGYPALKEFKIALTPQGSETVWFPENTVVPGNVRVDSRLYYDYVLSENGIRTPVEVNILVW